MHMLSQPIHVGAGQPERQLQELLGELQGPDARVQPGPWSKSQSPNNALPGNCCFPSTLGEELFQVLSSTLMLPLKAFPRVSWLILEERSTGDVTPETQVDD